MFDPDLGRSETPEEHKKRLEREHGELLQELRALIPGATVLFGFLLAISFTQEFGDLERVEKHVYYATLVSTPSRSFSFSRPLRTTACAFARATRTTCCGRATARRSPERSRARCRSPASSTS